jgi:hypothetical protein
MTASGVRRKSGDKIVIQGSCFCQRAKFAVIGDISAPWHCYCSHCSKLHGSAYATHVVVKQANFQWLGETDALKHVTSSPHNLRYFCGHCGSHLAVINENYPELVSVVCAALDNATVPEAAGQIFTASRQTWAELNTSSPCYERFPCEDVWQAYASQWRLT